MSLKTKGYLTLKELRALPGVPSEERLAKGPVVVIECAEEIPCNPCEGACPAGAIEVGETFTSLPILHEDECDGCGLCIPPCPGLAIFLVDMTFSESEGTVTIPYEFLPLPEKGDEVELLSRSGEVAGRGRVVRVQNPKRFDRTPLVTLAMPRELVTEVRHFRRLREEG